MNRRGSFSLLRWISVAFILAAVALFVVQLVQYSRIRADFPAGLTIGGVSVGQTDRQGAAERLLQVYSLPVELMYLDSAIQLDPSVVGFELDMESMLAAADQERTDATFWSGFWDFLWNRRVSPSAVPLAATYSETRLRTYLEQEIATRYDQPPVPAQPLAGTVNFSPGSFGNTLDVDRAVTLIENSLFSEDREPVTLPLQREVPPRPSPENLETLLRQTIELNGFDGTAGVYFKDLQTGQEIHFVLSGGEILPSQPDAAFSATSLIKIPIMVSVFRRIDNSVNAEVDKLLTDMISKSGNDPADWLMDQVIDPQRGPLGVSEDMEDLGLLSTFLAGYFAPGSPLLARYETPANQRQDLDTEPDPYSQTTPADIGMLLEDIYECAQLGGGTLLAAFPNEITQSECQEMINHLASVRIAVLFEAGIPEATQIAHKHGWVTDINGVINTIGDAGIVYSPGGNYVLVVFLYHPVQLIWDPSSELVADISEAVYNFYNLPVQ